ncbi:uncharacterized protein LOC114532427 isoform X1 [Dendronephthya gigantea]|uniref:uncharacterized protein LOC114532427 isoform X1 n=1 Tax=Dendronephthya gigantea TaxID=151771 RepID=UPI0010692E76|nr:uncharacterized protein LOC114532427 isoform X1 [Dendronephthya gigantea]
MENFDLLQHRNRNDIFRVSFDFYTPRPQFVIIPKDIESINPEFSAMTAEQTCVLIEAAKSVLSSFRIPSGVLSVHRGSWKSRPARSFHCHLCVDADRYLETFERRKKAIPNWPSVAYVTRQWCWNKDPHSYAQNVRGYPYKSRFKEDVSAIIQIMQSPITPVTLDNACAQATPTPWTQAQPGNCLSGIVYHRSHPKIGFVGKKDATVYDLHEILRAIENFAAAYGLTDMETEDKDYGCHVCLYLGAAPSDWEFSSQAASEYDIVGYLVTTGPRFYQLCPPEQRQSWFDAFQRSNFKCLT